MAGLARVAEDAGSGDGEGEGRANPGQGQAQGDRGRAGQLCQSALSALTHPAGAGRSECESLEDLQRRARRSPLSRISRAARGEPRRHPPAAGADRATARCWSPSWTAVLPDSRRWSWSEAGARRAVRRSRSCGGRGSARRSPNAAVHEARQPRAHLVGDRRPQRRANSTNAAAFRCEGEASDPVWARRSGCRANGPHRIPPPSISRKMPMTMTNRLRFRPRCCSTSCRPPRR